MTKSEFQDARVCAARDYKNKAEDDTVKYKNNKNKLVNAKRRFDLASNKLRIWGVEGFWTKENINAYETIYKSEDDIYSVSAF